MKKTIQVAIDGPSGAGKSTLAKRLAEELGYLYMDTGAMYRACGLKALREGIDPRDEEAVRGIPATTRVELAAGGGGLMVLLDGEDVSQAIRTPQVSMAASDISKHGLIRRWLVALQQDMAARENVVMEGRDIAIRVLPNAQFKYFLTASAPARAQRRYEELKARGQNVRYQDVLEDIEARDLQDSTREVDPLRRAHDAKELDTTGMSLEEEVEFVLRDMEGRL